MVSVDVPFPCPEALRESQQQRPPGPVWNIGSVSTVYSVCCTWNNLSTVYISCTSI